MHRAGAKHRETASTSSKCIEIRLLSQLSSRYQILSEDGSHAGCWRIEGRGDGHGRGILAPSIRRLRRGGHSPALGGGAGRHQSHPQRIRCGTPDGRWLEPVGDDCHRPFGGAAEPTSRTTARSTHVLRCRRKEPSRSDTRRSGTGCAQRPFRVRGRLHAPVRNGRRNVHAADCGQATHKLSGRGAERPQNHSIPPSV